MWGAARGSGTGGEVGVSHRLDRRAGYGRKPPEVGRVLLVLPVPHVTQPREVELRPLPEPALGDRPRDLRPAGRHAAEEGLDLAVDEARLVRQPHGNVGLLTVDQLDEVVVEEPQRPVRVRPQGPPRGPEEARHNILTEGTYGTT